MKQRTARIIVGVIIAVVFVGLGVAMWGCSTFEPAFAEARQAAVDAREAAERAEEYAQATGDPEAIQLAQEAKAQAAAVDAQLAELEAKALEWASAVESGEFGAGEGGEVLGLLGGVLAGPQGTVLGTILGSAIGGWYYRNRARQIVKAIDAGKAADPQLDEAFGSDTARKAISRNMSPRTWKFVEDQRE